MSVNTRSQVFAQAAYRCISQRNEGKPTGTYRSSAKKFSALIHTCGLAQAVSFARAKSDYGEYVVDLAEVLRLAGHSNIVSEVALDDYARNSPLRDYLRMSRDAINAASWLKRYVEAAGEDE